MITATMLYNFVQCPQRLFLDRFGNPAERDPVNPFVQLLWEKGTVFEQNVIENLQLPFVNLRPYSGKEREERTRDAMNAGASLIYGGRIRADDLLGDPDLLKRVGGGYIAGDIKCGAGEEGADADAEGRPKKHYAVQVAFYTDILERIGFSAGRNPFIWDVHGNEVPYDLAGSLTARDSDTLWDYYQRCLADVHRILFQSEETLPARSSICKQCHWYTVCMVSLERLDDLTLIPELGRSRRDAMLPYIGSVGALAAADSEALIRGKKTVIAGVGADTLAKFQARARLLAPPGGRPYLKAPVHLPDADLELFFDVETDPMRDICYLHGFLERRSRDNRTERYVSFFAEAPTPEAEARAFAQAWAYVQSRRPCTLYYYSPYERTIWRKLQRRNPTVAREADIDAMFSPDTAVDLYRDVVRPKTEWPTRDHSIKTLATYLGFRWRDTHPSGAASIEWYHRWVETGNPVIQRRILDYNEDDCTATRVLRDAIRKLPLHSP